jgi:hypothetical protein
LLEISFSLSSTYSGSFYPAKNANINEYECSFRLFTTQEARQCFGNRTIAFVGDSQIRDLAIGIGAFLQGLSIEDSDGTKFDNKEQTFLVGRAIGDDDFFLLSQFGERPENNGATVL